MLVFVLVLELVLVLLQFFWANAVKIYYSPIGYLVYLYVSTLFLLLEAALLLLF